MKKKKLKKKNKIKIKDKKGKLKNHRDEIDTDNVVHIAENVDKKGIFYVAKRIPEKYHDKFSRYFDKKQEDWYFLENEVTPVVKFLKKKGYRVKIARMSQAVMSLGEALEEFKEKALPRVKTKFKPLNRLLGGVSEDGRGGGFVRGGTYLISGEPGAGKSTLVNQLLLHWSKKRRVIYINTEETAQQVQDRFKRLNEQHPFNKKQKKNLMIMCLNDLNLARAKLKREDADIVVLDSIGGFVEASTAVRGGVKILKEAAGIIHDYVKWNRPDGVAIAVGHVNKEGRVAGPEAIQHMMDCVIMIQGSARIRAIQATKNRFGDTGSMISVAMTETGLEFEDSQEMQRDVAPSVTPGRTDGWNEM